MSNVFVFRIANDVDYVKNEIKQEAADPSSPIPVNDSGWGDW